MKPVHNSKTKRNAEIIRRYLAGETICALGIEYGVTRQRIDQIAKRAGEYRPHIPRSMKSGSYRWAKMERDAGRLQSRQGLPNVQRGKTPQIIALREKRLTQTKIAEILGVTQVNVHSALKRWRPDLVGDMRPAWNKMPLAFQEPSPEPG